MFEVLDLFDLLRLHRAAGAVEHLLCGLHPMLALACELAESGLEHRFDAVGVTPRLDAAV